MSHHAFNPEHLFLTRRQMLSRCGMGMAAVMEMGTPIVGYYHGPGGAPTPGSVP